MEGFIMLGGIVGFIICMLSLIVKAIRRKPKKKTAIAAAVCLAVAIFMFITWGSQPAIEVEKATFDTLQVDVLSEIKGDITEIEKADGLYNILVDGEYWVYTTSDVAGEFPSEGDNNVKMYVVKDADGMITVVSFPE